MPDQRLKGQEVSIRVVQAGNVVSQLDTVTTFNDSVAFELKEQGYLGEVVNRFDEILNGYGGDLEFHVAKSDWVDLITAIQDRATRRTPDVVFNVVRTDLYPNGDTSIITYRDVKWGPVPTTIGARGDYVKGRLEFRCEDRVIKNNSFL